MIKIANNLQRLVKQANSLAAMQARIAANMVPAVGVPQIMYSPELGGFHTPGTYPQSMLPEYYQDHQALGYINPEKFEESEYFGNPEQLAMALNTSGVAETFPEDFQNINNNAELQESLRKEFAKAKTERDYIFDFMGGLATKAYQSHKRKPDQPAVMPAAEIMSRDRRYLNEYEKIQRQMAQQRLNPGKNKGFIPYAAYDRSPDNPQGITARNPVSDTRVADLASKKIRERIYSRSSKR